MGFATVAANAVLIGTVIFIAVSLEVATHSYLVATNEALTERNENMMMLADESIVIESVSYDPDEGTTTISGKNDGSTKLITGTMDIYIDDIRIPREELNRTIDVSEVINAGLLDPGEGFSMEVIRELGSGTHLATVSTGLAKKGQMSYEV